MMEDRYRRRERVWMVVVTMLIAVVIALFVVVIELIRDDRIEVVKTDY